MQRCHQVEVGCVHCHELHTLCGDDTIELHFSHQHFNIWGGYLAGVVDSVTPYCESHLVWFCLFGSDRAYKLPVCNVVHAVCQYLLLEDELNSVGRVFMHPPMPFANCPNLLAAVRLHSFLYSGLFISCLKLMILLVSLSITVIAWWTLFSSCVIRHVRQTSLHWCHCCFMTAAAKPGWRVGGGTPDCCVREYVLE